jgi:hypothetical protein
VLSAAPEVYFEAHLFDFANVVFHYDYVSRVSALLRSKASSCDYKRVAICRQDFVLLKPEKKLSDKNCILPNGLNYAF